VVHFFWLRRDEITCVNSEIRGLTSDLSSSMKDIMNLVVSGEGRGGGWDDWLEVACAYV